MSDNESLDNLQQFVQVRRKNKSYFICVTNTTRSIDIKRMLTQFLNLKVHDLQLSVPRLDNRIFNDQMTVENEGLMNGEIINLQLRKTDLNQFEDINEASDDEYTNIIDTL